MLEFRIDKSFRHQHICVVDQQGAGLLAGLPQAQPRPTPTGMENISNEDSK